MTKRKTWRRDPMKRTIEAAFQPGRCIGWNTEQFGQKLLRAEVVQMNGGRAGTRTPDLLRVKQAL